MNKYVIGLDFGSDSVRAVIVDAMNGEEVANAVAQYPRWKQGLYCDPVKNQYRQHPQDYIDTMIQVIKESQAKLRADIRENIVGVSFDTTGSTPVMVNSDGVPLALTEEFAENPNAMFVLWKDHTANKEADEINELAKKWEIDFTKYEGGIYSSEWVWAKVLHVLRDDDSVKKATYSWIEHCDWMPALLTGNLKPEKVIRSRCAAGHKAMWHKEFDGLPSEEFLTTLDPLLAGFRDRLYSETFAGDYKVGGLSEKWAEILGLPANIAIGAGAFDCHMGAVGGGIKPYTLVRVMGTSTCDIIIAPNSDVEGKLIRGICGQVDGSVVPGMMGLEAGQSAFGDVYAWFRNLLSWATSSLMPDNDNEEFYNKIIPALSAAAAQLPDDDTIPLSTDWFNGRRTPDADSTLKATITGLSLGTSAPKIFKSLVEATAFGSRAIVERFSEEGVAINEVIAIGGVAKKSHFVMQTLADVMNMEIKVASTDESCAHGAAMFAATVADLYPKVDDAMVAMGQGFDKIYVPNSERVGFYDRKYMEYREIGSRESGIGGF
ncbi:MAG: ribulokinase [Bacteroidetes bacterium]|nr:ribulokinase [Bacteroidota bacterium]MBT4401937.1 ribulokinase [Bacteroidota bacterium]